MYLKKIDRPRSVTLPDGKVMTLTDLPPADTRRSVASRKGLVIKAVLSGLITKDTAKSTYALSDEEYAEWENAVQNNSKAALKATALKQYRQPWVEIQSYLWSLNPN
jgi:hypothetical protein